MRRYGQRDQSVLQRGFADAFFGLPTGGAVCRQKVASFTSFVDKSVDKREDTALVLLGVFVLQLPITSSI